MELEEIKKVQQKVWGLGNYAVIGTTLQIVAERLCEAVDLRGGQKVLDVATGSGNTAIAAARRSCEVTAVDYAPTLLELGRLRAAAEEVAVSFLEGDAEDLPVATGSFDVVLSTFGLMFAPNHVKAASEMLRACRPGGAIGMANWTPEGVFGQSGKVTAEFIPPNADLVPPVHWGTIEHLTNLFGEQVNFTSKKRTVMYRYRNLDHYMNTLRQTYPPLINTFSKLDNIVQEQLDRALRDLYNARNEARDGTFLMPMEYLEVVGKKIDNE